MTMTMKKSTRYLLPQFFLIHDIINLNLYQLIYFRRALLHDRDPQEGDEDEGEDGEEEDEVTINTLCLFLFPVASILPCLFCA
jgi:hypothetical protein